MSKPTTVGELLAGQGIASNYPQSVLDMTLVDAKIIIELYNKYKPEPDVPPTGNPYWASSQQDVEDGQAYWSEEGEQ